jgi:hypothetical protein
MDLYHFDIVHDICLDHMHLFNRGIMMRIMEMGFRTVAGKKRSSAPRLSLAEMNPILLDTLMPTELMRRTRRFDFKCWKGKI